MEQAVDWLGSSNAMASSRGRMVWFYQIMRNHHGGDRPRWGLFGANGGNGGGYLACLISKQRGLDRRS